MIVFYLASAFIREFFSHFKHSQFEIVAIATAVSSFYYNRLCVWLNIVNSESIEFTSGNYSISVQAEDYQQKEIQFR